MGYLVNLIFISVYGQALNSGLSTLLAVSTLAVLAVIFHTWSTCA